MFYLNLNKTKFIINIASLAIISSLFTPNNIALADTNSEKKAFLADLMIRNRALEQSTTALLQKFLADASSNNAKELDQDYEELGKAINTYRQFEKESYQFPDIVQSFEAKRKLIEGIRSDLTSANEIQVGPYKSFETLSQNLLMAISNPSRLEKFKNSLTGGIDFQVVTANIRSQDDLWIVQLAGGPVRDKSNGLFCVVSSRDADSMTVLKTLMPYAVRFRVKGQLSYVKIDENAFDFKIVYNPCSISISN